MTTGDFTDLGSTSVEVEITSDASAVWAMVSDPNLPAAHSDELYRAEWVPPSNGPELGARIRGWNRRGLHEWDTYSTVTACDPDSCFEWTVDSLHPGEGAIASWAFEITDVTSAGSEPRVRLRQRVALRPGRSGLTEEIDAHPRYRQRIIDKRLAQQAAAMKVTLDAVKAALDANPPSNQTHTDCC